RTRGERPAGIVQGDGPLVLWQHLAVRGVDVDVLLVGLPGDAGGLHQPGEARRIPLVHAAGPEGHVVIIHAEVPAGLLPEVIRERRVDPGGRVVIVAGP